MVQLRVDVNTAVIGRSLAEIRAEIPDLLLCAIEREHEIIIPKGDTILQGMITFKWLAGQKQLISLANCVAIRILTGAQLLSWEEAELPIT